MVLLPQIATFFGSFFSEGNFTLAHFSGVFEKEKLLLLWNSCVMAGSVALAATLMGGITGWLLARTEIPFPNVLKLLFLIPLFVAPYYFAVAWKDFFNMNGMAELQGKNWIVVFTHALCFFPLPMLIISSALSNIHRNIIEAGLLSADRLRVLFSVELPLVKHAIFASFILVFIFSISEVAVATYFITPSFSSDIFVQFAAFYHHEAAIASSFLLVTVCFLLLALEYSYLMRAPFLSIGTKGNPVKKMPLKKFRLPVFIIMLIFWAGVTVLPVVVLAYSALQAPPKFTQVRDEIVETEGGGNPFHYMQKAWELLQPVVLDSLVYAALGAVFICLLGFLFGYFSQRKGYRFFDFVLLLTFTIPAGVFGIGLIKFYNRPGLDMVYSSFLIILIAYLGRFTFIATKIMAHAIGKVPRSLEQAAMLTGASTFHRMRTILLPLISEGFFAAFIISFVFCLGEIGTTIVVYPPGSSLLPIKIATSMHNTPEGLMSAMVFIALMLTLVAMAVLFAGYYFISRKKEWKQA